jgi:uncharacterized membrane protein
MSENPQSTAHIAGHPLHPALIPLPITFLIATFLCDLGYWWTNNPGWATAAMWCLGAGIVTAVVAAIAGLTDFLGDARIRALSDAWQHFLANGLAVVLAIVNFYLRYTGGAEAAVFPAGIILSGAVVLILAFSGWKGGELVFRYRVGVLDNPRRGLP